LVSSASYLPLLERLRSLLRKRQKKVYTLAVGKLNPAKLANYLEVECFVLVACPENSLVQNTKVHILENTIPVVRP
jgi:diphthamide biosynthesis protein 2